MFRNGKTYADFVTKNADFVPKFLDEANQTLVAEAEVVCNGTQNQQCIFDYVFTLNAAVAQTTQNTQETAQANTEELGRFLHYYYFITMLSIVPMVAQRMRPHIVIPHQNCLSKTILQRGHSICFYGEILKIVPTLFLLSLLIWCARVKHLPAKLVV